jgi:ABC-2 type transport system ATP-binding protein
VRKLSLGERMKIELMAALLHNPQVIFLDEPTIGLDLSAQKAVRQFLSEYQKEFSPITILTSHYMEDIKELCPRIAVMKEGEIVFDGPLNQVQKMLGDQKVLTVTSDKSIFKLHVPRESLAYETQQIFQNHNVIDLNIQDPPIEEIIESLMKGGTTS